jgi:putative ABC transport system ATP-binding protein
METRQALIEIEGLTKVFYTDEIETHALSGIHLTISKGEYVAMSGPSGCGKSTLLSIIGLLDTPTNGKYLLNGHAVENLNFAQRSRIRNQEIGFIFQSFNLIGDLTVYENVELPLTYRTGMSSTERKRRVQESLERVSMAHRMKHYPSQLSGGQQQRVAVARALAGSPSILLADEPTGNLDSRNGEAVMELLQNLHRDGATICMVTHDPRFARHAERNIHLFDGKVVAEGDAIEPVLEARSRLQAMPRHAGPKKDWHDSTKERRTQLQDGCGANLGVAAHHAGHPRRRVPDHHGALRGREVFASECAGSPR